MDITQWHLILSHFPVLGTFFGGVFLTSGIVLKNNAVQKISLSIFIVTALISAVVYATGIEASQALGRLNLVSLTVINAHKQMASIASWFIGALGLISFIAFIPFKNQRTWYRFAVGIALFSILTLIATGMAVYTGYQINHAHF
ncbi:hypothetical protein [Xanthocytophaga agilis]|uniref:DUF2231 domain-containing protein n=1 Tax=Xanthocytophaga agilis TaxID=3048010 RepID=A0AAE3RE33_9BACT|nr:hypothetical protein [Xanthocytophaga agilis]MDJ1506452.1 hypothetical protein [Xanthocytophaga agilis]